ncbi:FAD-dependent oxidoreductase [Ramlibacter sp. G-1-2-2]|uniref:FAD-dependent oxidoreductase n=1 Tax=Ramlibacter agri TaxID=2728837 RepID=A0A848HDN8_9BURK|nr:FAD-dependent oxidoreductase [Ramlibacter agri]
MKPVIDCDVAVFGSGAAGLGAALVAACEGLKVCVFEKADALGGTTATSGGAAWIPGNSAARAAGAPDSVEDARCLLQDELGASWRADLVDAYLASGAEAVDYLAERTDVRFEILPSPDYVSDKRGASLKGRALAPLPFDGRLLGRDFALVRAPRPAFMILGGLMIGRREIPMFLRPLASWKSFAHVTRTLARYAADRLRFSRGTRLLMGNALVARALHSALRLGVVFHTKAALVSLQREGQRVTGATVRLDGAEVRVRAARAVVLATGGFPHGARLRDAHSPKHPHHHSLAAPESTGDAAEAALAIGAVIDDRLESPGFWTPASRVVDAKGRETLFPYGHMDRGKPGAIIVDRNGRRFVNEADSYHHVVLAMFERRKFAPHDAAFIVCDSDFIRKYGLGLAKPAPFPVWQHVRSGYLRRGATVRELAVEIGVDAAGLEAEVARHNAFAASGNDSDFRKGSTAFNRYNGDPAVQPNPCLAPIARGPFYAMEILPCTIAIAAGLKTDADARVVDASGNPIPGLYACGNDMASFTRGAYPGPGITIGPALVFAYRAMQHARRNPA